MNFLRIQALPSFLESPFQALIAAPELFATLQFEITKSFECVEQNCSIVPLHVLSNMTAVASAGKAWDCVQVGEGSTVRCNLGSPFGPHGMAINLALPENKYKVTLTLGMSIISSLDLWPSKCPHDS
jgi:hypothetical protein